MRNRNQPSGCDDYIQAKDIEAYVEELRSDREALVDAVDEAKEALEEAQKHLNDFDPDAYDQDNDADGDGASDADVEKARRQDAVEDAESDLNKAQEELEEFDQDSDLKMWGEVLEELANYGAVSNDEMLIAEDEFVDYIEQDLKDCGTLPDDIPPFVVIDWEATAANCKYDYTEIEIDGSTFLFRAN